MRTTSTRLLALAIGLTSASAFAQTIPSDLALSPFITSGLSQPVALRHAGDGSNRIFIVQKGGAIQVGQLGADGSAPASLTTFLSRSVTTSSESGLLGLAFHPNFAENGYFYIAFTAPNSESSLGSTPDQVVARYRVSEANPNVADPNSRLDIIRIPDLAGNHNGGDLHFGPDGYLYYSSGDGGPQVDPNGFAQCNWKKPANSNRTTCTPGGGTNYWLLGKIIRLDVDSPTASATAEMCGATAGQPANYSIPSDNPMVGTSNTCDEIWHTGLRNPWRFSFDRATGDMYIGDVGQSEREEVNLALVGETHNFGWVCMEGFAVRISNQAPCINSTTNSLPSATLPILDYPRADGGAISGGFMYRGPIRALHGIYWFGDSNNGRVWYATDSASPWPKALFTTHSGNVGFGEDEAGNVYSVSINGNIRKLTSSDSIFFDGFE